MSDKELGFIVTPGEQQLSVQGLLLPPSALVDSLVELSGKSSLLLTQQRFGVFPCLCCSNVAFAPSS